MNFTKTQGSFFCTDVPLLNLNECIRHRTTDTDENARYFVVFTNGKLTRDIYQRFILGTYSCHSSKPVDIVVFSEGTTSDARESIEHLLSVYPKYHNAAPSSVIYYSFKEGQR